MANLISGTPLARPPNQAVGSSPPQALRFLSPHLPRHDNPLSRFQKRGSHIEDSVSKIGTSGAQVSPHRCPEHDN